MGIITDVYNAYHAKRQAALRAREAKAIAAFSELNDGMSPTIDCNGRFHAPCDGYSVPYDCYATGDLFNKGEFLPVPEDMYTEEYHKEFKEFGHKAKLLMNSAMIAEWNSISGLNGIGQAGKSWEKDGDTYCYLYVTAHKPLVVAMQDACEAYKKQEADKAKLSKGVAPVGRVTVTATILHVSQSMGLYGPSLKVLLELENKSTVYGTLPSCIDIDDAVKGAVMEFTATFEHANGDNTHSFYKRPKVVDFRKVSA